MKILHITTIRSGSTGRTAMDLKKFIYSKGGQYKIAFSEQDGKPLDGDLLIGSRFDHKVHAFLSRLFGLQGYFSFFATKRFLKRVQQYKPDIVQLGNLHANYINLPLLFKYLARRRIPVVMILHDCWFFTGKCTHFTELKCDRWQSHCKQCPALRKDNVSWFFDCTEKMFHDRKVWYEGLVSLTVVAVSDWEKDIAQKSPLFAKARVTRIYNWIDTFTFKPASAEEKIAIAEKYLLDTKKKYVITVGAGWTTASSKTKEAIQLSQKLQKGWKLVIVGRNEENVFPDDIICIPYVSSPVELSILYSIASAYVHLSVEDTFGKVIAEAMACGTVPIVYDSTACPETAGPYGIAVRPHDVGAIVSIIQMSEDSQRSINVRRYALENYSLQVNTNKYFERVYSVLVP